ncbi:MAG TPA: malectin domain-containing carbohydrate-binding protein, partial [Verrucomicrobiae bacterium]|nr:malectin domain-containing carbohydrate-binding protein [Verrucomicrobiae bacterium]
MNTTLKNLCRGTILTVLLVLAAPLAVRADESCKTCGRPLDVIGQFNHFKIGDDQVIQGAAPGEEAAFREEIYGNSFTVSVPHLPAGKYTVIVGETEAFFNEPGKRLFDITSGDVTIASNLDIFAAT